MFSLLFVYGKIKRKHTHTHLIKIEEEDDETKKQTENQELSRLPEKIETYIFLHKFVYR